MNASILVDTNVLVYAYDRAAPDKQRQAIAVVDALARRRLGVVSTQVLSEFFVAVTRKIVQPLTVAEARRRIDVYIQTWTVLDLTGMIVLEAARGVETYQLSFWDAQIWAAARLNQIAHVFSEDFNVGATIEGVQFINPFEGAFRLDDWMTP
jgi:predicted nucleic acid-binding protein